MDDLTSVFVENVVQYPEFVQGDSPRIGVFLGEGVAGEEQR